MLNNQEIKLTYKVRKGETLNYLTVVNSVQQVEEEGQPPQGVSSTIEMSLEQAAVMVHADESADIEVFIASGTVKQGDEVESLPSVGQKMSMTMAPSGKILKSSVDSPLSQPAFPDKTLTIGESWATEAPMDIPVFDDEGNAVGQKSISLTYKYTLKGVEALEGRKVAVVDVSCEKTTVEIQEGMTQSIEAKGTTYFDHENGLLARSEIKTTTIIEAEGAKVTTDVEVVVKLKGVSGSNDNFGGGDGTLGGGDEAFIIS